MILGMGRRTEAFREKLARKDDAFTLVELLIVIVILGILAAIVVIAVSGVTSRGRAEACRVDTQNVTTAEENYYAANGRYAPEASLVPNFLRQESTLVNASVTPSPSGTAYVITTPDPSACTG